MKAFRQLSLMVVAIALLAVTTAAARAAAADPAGKSPPRSVLRYGDRNATVSSLQQQLKALGFDPGPVDGIFGPRTLAAVRSAQKGLGLQVDGLAGPLTMARLEAAVAGKSAQTAAQPPEGPESPAPPSHSLAPVASEKGLDLYAAGVDGGETATAAAPALPASSPQLFALTFNGDPDTELLPGILATLKRHGMQATFFLHGAYAERNPDVVARITAEGHEIASAGYTAQDLSALGSSAASAQIGRANQALEKAAGQAPAFFRPPDGKLSQSLLQAAQKANLKLALWTNVGQMDLPGVDPDKLARGLAESISPGAIYMLHQNRPAAAQALEKLLQSLGAKGYRSVALSRLITP